MKNIFKIIQGEGQNIYIGIEVTIDDREVFVPVSEICRSHDELVAEGEVIKKYLDKIIEKAKDRFNIALKEELPKITPAMSPEEIWSLLSKIEQEDQFIKGFNVLDKQKRMDVAEHVLTRCNIFSGKASVFSTRYNNETGFLE